MTILVCTCSDGPELDGIIYCYSHCPDDVVFRALSAEESTALSCCICDKQALTAF